MDLHVQLYELVKHYGRDVICLPQLVAMMDDEEIFRPYEHREYKQLYRIMVKQGFVKNVFEMNKWSDHEAEVIEQQIASMYSGKADIHYAVQSIAFALGWLESLEIAMVRQIADDVTQDVGLESNTVEYIAHGSNKCIGTLIPSAMALPVHNQLNIIAKEEGGVAQYVMDQMQISDQKELEKKLSGEQIDGVAMAIRQMSSGRGFILGDMTGIGKGRQVAMLLKWATLQGDRPVFVTEKTALFTDLYRDLFDIGYDDLRPFILNSDKDARIVDEEGNVVYNLPEAADMEEFKTTHSIPAGYDFLLLTYSQLTRNPEKNWKAECVKDALRGSYLIMDESHNASGADSNVGAFFREAVQISSGVCFSSATYAKYPSSMPLYAIKTAMGEANIPANQLIDIIEHGGPILQEVMAKGLVASGSMVRRQRDMSGVERSLYTPDNTVDIVRTRERYDIVIQLIQDIYDFQQQFISPYLTSLSAESIIRSEHKISAAEIFDSHRTHIHYTRFSNRMIPTIRQLLFAIKADDAIAVTLRELKSGRKPVVQVSRTMESNIAALVEVGAKMPKAEFALTLISCLEGMFKYAAVGETKQKVQRGKAKVRNYRVEKTFDLKTLDKYNKTTHATEAYKFIVEKIRKTSTELPLSPIDYYVSSIEAAGYKVGELTQRKHTLKYTDVNRGANSEVECQSHKTGNKKNMAAAFNNGKLDVLIGNSVMASGISLHSSQTFSDKRQRVTITWEQQDSADRQTQFDGRTDRTGQLSHSAFIVLTSAIPAEQRFLMMNDRKQRSLNANVEARQYSDNNCIDILNIYGAQVANEFIRENPELASVFESNETLQIGESNLDLAFIKDFMRTICLVKCDEQEAILAEVQAKYVELISYLDDIGENDLKPKSLPLNAKLLKRSVFFAGKSTSRSLFGQDAMLDEVEVDVLRRPMTAEQIRTMMSSLKSASEIKPLVIQESVRKQQSIKDYYKNLQDEAKCKLQQVAMAQLSFTPRRIEKLKERAYSDSAMDAEMMAVSTKTSNLLQLLSLFNIGEAVGIPLSLSAMGEIDDPQLIDYVSLGLFLGFKFSSRPTPSNIKAVFAVNDGRCRMEIPLSDYGKLRTIHTQSHLGIMKQRISSVSLSSWDSMLTNKSREKAYIITGNLLLGISVAKLFGKDIRGSKKQRIAKGKGQGHIIAYTDDTGHIRNGYLLSRMFRPEDVGRYAPKSLS